MRTHAATSVSVLRFLGLFAAMLPFFGGCAKKGEAPTATTPVAEATPSTVRQPVPLPTRVLRISQRNEPGDLDPAKATLPDEFALLHALSEGLYVPGMLSYPGSSTRPGLAEIGSVSQEGLVHTFHLRPTARWSNGDPLTAADFVASYRRMLTPATASPKASVFFIVKNARAFLNGEIKDFGQVGFHAPDAHTLVITLEHRTPSLVQYLASGPWLPVHLPSIEKHGRKWTQPGNFVGNGPYILAEWKPHQRIVMKKNPHWDRAPTVQVDELHFIHFDNGDAEERAYRAGQVDVTMAVPNSKVDVYAAERPGELHRAAMIETRYLTFNTKRPALADVRVRRALVHALDRATLAARVTRGGQEAASSFLPSALPLDTQHPQGTPVKLAFDPAVARRLLAEAGFPDGKGFPRFELTGWANNPILEAIQQMWKQHLGIEVSILVREAKVHIASLQSGAYDIGFITEIPEVADANMLLENFRTGSPDNYPQWSDPAYDALLERILSADFHERGTLQLEASNHLVLAAPVAPLYYNTKVWLMIPTVRNWREDGLWTRSYHTLSLDR